MTQALSDISVLMYGPSHARLGVEYRGSYRCLSCHDNHFGWEKWIVHIEKKHS
jgi:hypothetical protein